MSNLNSPVISLVNNELRTISTDVAAYFGRQHQVVMRQIRQIMANCPESFNGCNFALVEMKDAKGEMRPRYSLTKDAFMLVVMGFTGHKAMQCKLAYIEEFNRMRSQLGRTLPEPSPTITSEPQPESLPHSQPQSLPQAQAKKFITPAEYSTALGLYEECYLKAQQLNKVYTDFRQLVGGLVNDFRHNHDNGCPLLHQSAVALEKYHKAAFQVFDFTRMCESLDGIKGTAKFLAKCQMNELEVA